MKVFRLDIPPEQAQVLADRLAEAAEAGLFHPSIVEPIAAGVEGTVAYRAEEYVASESFDVAVRERAPQSLADVVAIVAQLAAALDIARAAGVGHGALHPRDVFLGHEDARISGFGIVRALEDVGIRAPVRRPYAAPERVAGGDWAMPADVFSLAAITFELMTGRRPSGTGLQFGSFDQSPFEQAPALVEVFARAMHEDPRRRFTTATAFSDALARVDAVGRGITFTPPALTASSLLDLPQEVAAFADEDGSEPDAAIPPAATAAAAASRWIPRSERTELDDRAGGGHDGEDAGRDQRIRGSGPATDFGSEDEFAPEGAAAEDIEAERESDEAHWALTRDEQAAASDDRQLYSPDDVEAAADELAFDAAEVTLGGSASIFAGDESGEPEPEDDDEDVVEEREDRERWAPGSEPDPEPDPDMTEDDVDEPEPRPSYGRAVTMGLGLSAAAMADDGEPRRFTFEAEGPPEEPARPVYAQGPGPAAREQDRMAEALPRRPYRRLEDDEIVGAEQPAAAERVRPAMLPLAMMLILGLLVGFAAGFTVGERSVVPPAAVGTAPAGTPGSTPDRTPTVGTGAPAADGAGGVTAADRPAAPPTAVPDTAGDAPPSSRPAAVAPVAPAPSSGHLIVRSTPPGAAVTVDGKWTGRTPLTLNRVALGAHAVRIVLPGYETVREDLTLTSGAASRTLSVALRRDRAAAPAPRPTAPASAPAPAGTTATTGILEIESRPTAARVLVDGSPRGTTPVRIPEIAPGEHLIRLELADHQPWTTTAQVAAGQTVRVGGSLEPIR